VTHLVHDRGKQINSAGGRGRGIGITARRGDVLCEEIIALQAGFDEPAIAGSIAADADVIALGFAKLEAL
jgi:hypothetical protein